MATGTATPTVTSTSWNGSELIMRGTVAFSSASDTYATGGLTISFAGLAGLESSSIPLQVTFFVKSAPTNLFVYKYVFGTTQANGLIQIFTGAAAQTALTELSNGTALTSPAADTIGFVAYFLRV